MCYMWEQAISGNCHHTTIGGKLSRQRLELLCLQDHPRGGSESPFSHRRGYDCVLIVTGLLVSVVLQFSNARIHAI